MRFREKLCRDFGEALVDHAFIHGALLVARIARNHLSSDHVGGSTNPVDSLPASVTKHLLVHLPRRWQLVLSLGKGAFSLHLIEGVQAPTCFVYCFVDSS